jgi:hypothetical protein
MLIMALDNEYISKVLEITESHPDSRALRMVELAPGVVTVVCYDPVSGGIDSYFDMDRWEVDQDKLANRGNPRALHYIFDSKRIGTLQGSDTSGRDNCQESYWVMKGILKPVNGSTFHDEPQVVDLEGRLPQ